MPKIGCDQLFALDKNSCPGRTIRQTPHGSTAQTRPEHLHRVRPKTPVEIRKQDLGIGRGLSVNVREVLPTFARNRHDQRHIVVQVWRNLAESVRKRSNWSQVMPLQSSTWTRPNLRRCEPSLAPPPSPPHCDTTQGPVPLRRPSAARCNTLCCIPLSARAGIQHDWLNPDISRLLGKPVELCILT